ncbi:NAD(P)-binding protein [Aspergillus sclerotiicarbonarius CBS 121057]|uniref:NAD(P)-binding protein n=1 Tax=Aspergillus sclerotiicarbonarius (strain CBS 121057 / IBT 28362) TaxID=1448318 RepID=A0A319FMZ4_ASPSB|nr:NAD(P)-binding protein [Aspergillus sclerotiicarbonarius CBS 121057]
MGFFTESPFASSAVDLENPYYEQHVNARGAGDDRPTALQIVADNRVFNEWHDKVVLITGATGEIGLETAIALHSTGAHVFITARHLCQGKATMWKILTRSSGNGPIDILELEMESLDSVKKAADEFLKRSPTLNILINNAGICEVPKGETRDKFESHFGINHLAHFTLITKLLPALKAGSSSSFKSRIVQVSSIDHQNVSVDFNDINFTSGYNAFIAYARSKTAMIWTANYINSVYGTAGVHALSVHPGMVWSRHQQHIAPDVLKGWTFGYGASQVKSPEQGAATTVWAAVGKVWEGRGGVYLMDCRFAGGTHYLSIAPEEFNNFHPRGWQTEERLWRLSLQCTGMPEPFMDGMTPPFQANNLGLRNDWVIMEDA